MALFSDPKSNIEQFDLTPGMKVADLGAGAGFYTLEIAKRVGDTGKVFAVDIQKELLAKVKNTAAKEHLFNVEIVAGDLEKLGGSRLRDFSVDGVVISNIAFQITDKDSLIKETKRILKPGGRVLFIDWEGSFGGIGPAPKDVFPKTAAKAMFEKNGFSSSKEISAGSHHYGFVFKKST